ncbi:MAG: ADYC domain-containing protein [Nannocystaceae bacterium]
MTRKYARLATLTLTVFSLLPTACDTIEHGSDERLSFRPGGFSSGTFNTSNWVSPAARDIYEANRDGSWHTNSYGFETRLASISFEHPTHGTIVTDPGHGTPPGHPRVELTDADDLEARVKIPNEPLEFFQGADLVGLELLFEVKYQGGPIYPSKLRITDHVGQHTLYTIHKIDPSNGNLIAPICEMSSDGDRFAAVFGGISIDASTGAVTEVDDVFHIACTASAPGKSPTFGYTPHGDLEVFRLVNRVIRADYCADGHPYTYPGNTLEIRDNFSPGSVGTTLADIYDNLGGRNLEAVWDESGILCLETPRVSTLSSVDVVCPVKTVNGQPEHNWQPPPCETFIDPNPSALRFFSLSEGE